MRALAILASATSVSVFAAAVAWQEPAARPPRADARVVHHRTVDVDGVPIFYREAGAADAPVVLLLHGFPTSSHMFRHLLPALADRWRAIAPDYPGFGASGFPPASDYEYSFANLERTVDAFTRALGIERFALYVQDYGAPIGFRLLLRDPSRVTALVVQNGNAYAEGLSEGWAPLQEYWREPTPARREALRGWLTPDGLREQYTAGLAPAIVSRVSPDTWTLDTLRMARPGNLDVQLRLFADYQTNVALYPAIQQALRDRRPPTLVVWGARDPFFTVAGARAYSRDVPDAELHLLADAGHFALETHFDDVVAPLRAFLGRHLR